MSKRLFIKLAALPLIALLAGCANAPETTRALGFQEFQQDQLTHLAKRFRSETPYVVLFDFDRFDLDATARRRLDIQAQWILANPKVKFRIAGHTDKVGDLAYNEALGLKRANMVLAYFVSKGIDPDRLVAMASFGEEIPIVDTELPERANRRVTTDVLGFVEELRRDVKSDSFAALSPQTGDVEATPVGNDAAPDDRADAGAVTGDTGTDAGRSNGRGSSNNSGRGNGDEEGDPGNSEGQNKGGDE